VLVQQLVPAEACGIVFSANPITGNRNEVLVTSSWGLGESLVGGTVSPDTYIVRKTDLAMVLRQIGLKLRITVPVAGGTCEVNVPVDQQVQPAISDAQCLDAVRLATSLETEMSFPVDVECAWSAGVLYLLQCRPITTLPDSERKQ
jgi:pyruvate,water dikinase